MIVRLSDEAEHDYFEAAEYHDSLSHEIGNDFDRLVELAIDGIIEWPERWQKVRPDTRRALVFKYHYGIFYIAKPGEILVVAIMDLRRNWIHELKRRHEAEEQ